MKLTVSQGGVDIEEGAYAVVLVKVEGPKTIDTQDGPKDILEWTFAVIDGDYADTEIRDSTSMATSPRSKMFGWLTALANGKKPDVGLEFDTDALLGRTAVATIEVNDRGYPKIKTLSAMPRTAAEAALAGRMGLPSQAPARQAPARAPQQAAVPAGRGRGAAAALVADADDLPF